ncbi:MAG TPA: prepilin-type N-terminal cleavage/methylation domain-containing protein [Solirubrobacteraceae bacterium]|nr:prepilin-type N-terminal cleavage/methylation domain-containing protein [Solirubrobacteraceae bacterium]
MRCDARRILSRTLKDALARADESLVMKVRTRSAVSAGQEGFTLIELLVVILIIGILAAIAIPALLSQKSKAYDAGAKELARTAEVSAEAYASDHEGSYANLSLAELHKYEPSIPTSKEAAHGGAYLEGEPTVATNTYEITAVAASTGDKFTVARNSNGEVTRTCTSAGTKKDCSGSATGSW